MFALFEAGLQVISANHNPRLRRCAPYLGLTVWHLSEVLPYLGLTVWHLSEVLVDPKVG